MRRGRRPVGEVDLPVMQAFRIASGSGAEGSGSIDRDYVSFLVIEALALDGGKYR